MKVGDSVKLSAVGQHVSWLKKYQDAHGTIVSYNPSNLWMVKWNIPNGNPQTGMKSSDIQVVKEDVSSE